MVKKLLVIGILGFMLVGFVSAVNFYTIPNVIPQDYDCEEHPGIISESKPAPFESSQHYVNRKNKAIQKQIEGVCN
jgi:hypothetical protein